MKLKERPLSWWKGKLFRYWAKADVNDTRKINYTIKHRSIGQGMRVFHFTSNDLVGADEMYWVRTGRIQEIKQENNEWFVTMIAGIMLQEDFS